MKNKVVIKGEVAEIHVDSEKHGHKIVLIDSKDLPLLDGIGTVYVSDDRSRNEKREYIYAHVRYKGKGIRLHRFLYMADGYEIHGKVIDHIEGNRLDNRRSTKLRIVTQAENCQNIEGLNSSNTSGVRGVYFDSKRQKWRVQVDANGKRHRLGRYNTLEEAAVVAERARQELHVQ